jgi:hypothetical protein
MMLKEEDILEKDDTFYNMVERRTKKIKKKNKGLQQSRELMNSSCHNGTSSVKREILYDVR